MQVRYFSAQKDFEDLREFCGLTKEEWIDFKESDADEDIWLEEIEKVANKKHKKNYSGLQIKLDSIWPESEFDPSSDYWCVYAIKGLVAEVTKYYTSDNPQKAENEVIIRTQGLGIKEVSGLPEGTFLFVEFENADDPDIPIRVVCEV